MTDIGLTQARDKMHAAGVGAAAIRVFESHYANLADGAGGYVREADIEPLLEVDMASDVDIDRREAEDALDRTAILKLNGGLGTSMGLAKAKNLLEVRDGLTFLDIIARQVLAARQRHGVRLPLLFMNSFRTEADTRRALEAYPQLAVPGLPLCFLQNQEPKLRVDDLTPIDWPRDPSLEWCPPGHGDVYTALDDSGILDLLLERGYEYLFLSNGDNLGATPDALLAGWFAQSSAPYAAELCTRTANDRKGGHLAIRRRDGQLVLRDTAQTAPEEMDFFTDEHRHPYFHTNNLWVHLPVLKRTLQERTGVLGLPLIRNEKTVDPADPTSPAVIQMETAMGAAIEVFPGASAIGVDRNRFLPVKTTNELLLLRSDLFSLDEDHHLTARGPIPEIRLDNHYKIVQDFDRRIPHPLGLLGARSRTVLGDVSFGQGVTVRGHARIDTAEPMLVPDHAVLGDPA